MSRNQIAQILQNLFFTGSGQATRQQSWHGGRIIHDLRSFPEWYALGDRLVPQFAWRWNPWAGWRAKKNQAFTM